MIDQEKTIELVCECNSGCYEPVTLTLGEAMRIAAHHPGWVMISTRCQHGAEPTDRLLERHENYVIYEKAV